MKIFSAYDKPIKKQILISGKPENYITDKTIMTEIVKGDKFHPFNINEVIIRNHDTKLFDTDKPIYVIDIDSSVWILNGKSTDMNSTIIPYTYDITIIGILQDITIDIDEIEKNKEIVTEYSQYLNNILPNQIDEYKSMKIEITDYDNLLNYIFEVYDPNNIIHNAAFSKYENAKKILKKTYERYKTIRVFYRSIIVFLLILLILIIFFQ